MRQMLSIQGCLLYVLHIAALILRRCLGPCPPSSTWPTLSLLCLQSPRLETRFQQLKHHQWMHHGLDTKLCPMPDHITEPEANLAFQALCSPLGCPLLQVLLYLCLPGLQSTQSPRHSSSQHSIDSAHFLQCRIDASQHLESKSRAQALASNSASSSCSSASCSMRSWRIISLRRACRAAAVHYQA